MMFGLKHYVSSKTSRCPFRDVFFFLKFQVENLEAFKSHILVGFNGKLLVTFGG